VLVVQSVVFDVCVNSLLVFADMLSCYSIVSNVGWRMRATITDGR
jgi:hypothetical protein